MNRRSMKIFGLLLSLSAPLLAADDAAVFQNYCAACHGSDGRARTPQGRKMRAKDLRESSKADPEIARQIREGSLIKTGVSVMPPVGQGMTEAEIEAVIRVVKSFRQPASPTK